MCPHGPECEWGHVNQVITAHVICVTEPVTINHVSVINYQVFNSVYLPNSNVYHCCRMPFTEMGCS